MAENVNEKKTTKKSVFFLILGGVLIGVLNGFFGGGGGMLCVPLIKKIMDLKDKNSHATTVLIMSVISIPSLIVYITSFGLDFKTALPIVVGVVLGGLLGAKLLSVLKNNVINLIFILLMIAVGIKMLF